jgi:hypothetical protein
MLGASIRMSVLEAGGAMVQREVLEGWESLRPGPTLMQDGQPIDDAFNFSYGDPLVAAAGGRVRCGVIGEAPVDDIP